VDSPRTYTGWKAALLAVAACVVVYSALNLLVRASRPARTPAPRPTVVTVTPTSR
jgi:hypothetical protein